MDLKKDIEKKHQEDFKNHLVSLSLKEKIKVVAINEIQNQIKNLDEELDQKIKALTLEYEGLQIPLHGKINEIIEGKRPPNELELAHLGEYISSKELSEKNSAIDDSSLNEFWLKAIKNCEPLANELKENDLNALKYLKRVEYERIENTSNFTLRFHFEENPFFKNSILKKTFFMHDDETPLKSEGTEIDWKQGFNFTKKIVKKKQKNKKTGHTKMVEREVDDESFFNFFKSTILEEDQEESAELEEKLNTDFDISIIIMDDLIPNSLDYYLGIKLDVEEAGDDEFEDEEEEEDDEDEDDEKSDSDQEENVKKEKKNKHAHLHKHGESCKGHSHHKKSHDNKSHQETAASTTENPKKPECKQQ